MEEPVDREFDTALADLGANGLLPAAVRAVFITGSVTRGWANPASDVDVYVVSADDTWTGTGALHVPLRPDVVPTATTVLGGRRWELKYWLDDQIRQVLDKMSWSSIGSRPVADLLGKTEVGLLARICTCVPITGADWVARVRGEIQASPFQAVLVAESATAARFAMEDAAGQAAAADLESAVLSARLAFGHAVDALLLQRGELDRSPKWRARRMRGVAPPELSFTAYWEVESMTGLDPAAPRDWVGDVLRRSAELLDHVAVDPVLAGMVSAGSVPGHPGAHS
jgi:hypothetical protein